MAPSPKAAGVLLLATLAGNCQAPAIAPIYLVACNSDADCRADELCDIDHDCQVLPPNTQRVALNVPCRAPGECGAGQLCSVTGACIETTTLGTLLDDFEDFDAYPSDERFAVWQDYSYNPMNQYVFHWVAQPSLEEDGGYMSNGGMRWEWRIEHTPDRLPGVSMAALRTVVSEVTVDMSSYSRLVFSHKFEHPALLRGEQALQYSDEVNLDVSACRSFSEFAVDLRCDELHTSFQTTLPTSPTWLTSTVPFGELHEPSYAISGVSLQDCLRVADTLTFSVVLPLAEGECASGLMSIDNISFRPD